MLLNSLTDKEQINAQEERFGWELSTGMTVVVVGNNRDTWHIKDKDLDRFIIKRLRSRYSDIIYTRLGTCLVIVFRDNNQAVKRSVGKLAQNIKETAAVMQDDYDISLYIGIGSFAKDAVNLAGSYNDARLAERMAKRMNKTIVTVDELRAYQVLSRVSGDDNAQALVKTYIGCLRDYDKEYQTEYFDTLKALVENDWNLKRVAEAMFIHYNTVKYRYAKIGDLLGEDLRSNEPRFNIALALRLYEIQV